MDFNVLRALKITATDPAEILEALREKQIEDEQRLENPSMPESRRAQLQEELAQIEEQIAAATVALETQKSGAMTTPKTESKAEAEAGVKHGAIPMSVSDKDLNKRVIPTPVSEEELKKETSKWKKTETPKTDREAELRKKKHDEDLAKQAKALSKRLAEASKKDAKAAATGAGAASGATSGAPSGGSTPVGASSGGSAAGSGATSSASTPEASALEKELNEAIAHVSRGEYDKAFPLLSHVANEGEKAHLAKDKLGVAEWTLGTLYKNGQGVAMDKDRASFWFERGADHDNAAACMEYAMYFNSLKPTTVKEVKDAIDNALKYFQKAASLGAKGAKKKYIELVEMQLNLVSSKQKHTAAKYIDEIIATTPDAYDKDQLKERKDKILVKPPKDSGSSAKGSGSSGRRSAGSSSGRLFTGVRDVILIIGSLFFVSGLSLMSHTGVTLPGTNFIKFNGIARTLGELFPFRLYYDTIYNSVGFNSADENVLFLFFVGFMKALFGSTLIGVGRKSDNGTIAKIVCEISTVYMYISLLLDMFGGMSKFVWTDDFANVLGFFLVTLVSIMGVRLIAKGITGFVTGD